MHLFEFHFRFQFSIFLKMNVILLKTPKILIGFIRFEESPVAFKVFFYVVVVIFSRMSIVLESYSPDILCGGAFGWGRGRCLDLRVFKNLEIEPTKNKFVGSYLRDYNGWWKTDCSAGKCQFRSTKMVIVTC